MIELIGVLAGTCTTISFIPQVFKTIKSKDTSGISFYMYFLFISGVMLWLVFGVLINSLSMIIANAITFCLASIVLYLKSKSILQERRNRKIAG